MRSKVSLSQRSRVNNRTSARSGFYMIPDGIAACSDLTPAEKLVYGGLLRFCTWYDSESVQVTYENLAKRLGLSVKTIERSCKKLEQVGLVKREHQRVGHDGILVTYWLRSLTVLVEEDADRRETPAPDILSAPASDNMSGPDPSECRTLIGPDTASNTPTPAAAVRDFFICTFDRKPTPAETATLSRLCSTYPEGTLRYAFQEGSDHGKQNLRYIERVAERMLNNPDGKAPSKIIESARRVAEHAWNADSESQRALSRIGRRGVPEDDSLARWGRRDVPDGTMERDNND